MYKTCNVLTKELKLVNKLANFAFASEMNPMQTYVKFVLTDDKPNANGVRIPKEEFINLVNSGIFMPIKMALVTETFKGHFNSVPLGVIAHLEISDSGDEVVGVGVLWNEEFEDEIAIIKERVNKGKAQLSWEIAFTNEEVEKDEEGGIVRVLEGTFLRATTVVDFPAYQGRTPITEVDTEDDSEHHDDEKKKKKKKKKKSEETIIIEKEVIEEIVEEEIIVEPSPTKLPVETFAGDKKIEEEEKNVEKLQEELDALKLTHEAQTEELSEAQETIKTQNTDLQDLQESHKELVTFKEATEAEQARQASIEALRNQFIEAGVEYDVDSNLEILLEMSEDAVGLFVNSLSQALKEEKAEKVVEPIVEEVEEEKKPKPMQITRPGETDFSSVMKDIGK